MGGYGSGYGTKRPDHPTGSVTGGIPKTYDQQTKHLKSVFSDKLDPSCHADKRKRDVLAGLPDPGAYSEAMYKAKKRFELRKMEDKRRQALAMEARDLQDLARKLANKAIKTAVDIMDDPETTAQVKIQVIQMILDRGYGRPAATVLNINQDIGSKPSQLNDRSLNDRIEDALTRVERLTKGATEEAESPKRPINLREYN